MDLHLIGQIYGCIGIPNHTRDLFREIITQRPDARIFPLFPVHENNYDLDAEFKKHVTDPEAAEYSNTAVFIFWAPDVYPQCLKKYDDTCLKMGYLIFEWTKLTESYKKNALLMDILFVPSPWHKQVLLDNCIPEDKIRILKAGVNPAYRVERQLARRKKFLFVGKYEQRKCVEEMLGCFTTMVDEERASLTLLCTDPHDPSFEVSRLPYIGRAKNIFAAKSPSTVEGMAELYASHQYILVPSRAGGIELPLVEAMAQGCVPIVTKASGMQHYLPKDYEFFIPVRKMVPMYDNRWFSPTIDWGVWAEPDWNVFNTLLLKASNLTPTAESELVKAHTLVQCDYPTIVRDFLKSIER